MTDRQDGPCPTFLEGRLAFMGLADVFQILGGNQSTGVLQLTTPYSDKSGYVYFVNGSPVNATFGSLAGIEAIYALFGWTEGHFEFYPGGIDVEQAIGQSRMQIVLDALRMFDDGMIKRVGPPSFVDPADSILRNPTDTNEGALSIIKGPQVDFMYVVKEEIISDGGRIVTEGTYGHWVWVILGGDVQVTRETLRGPMTLAQLGRGAFIGHFTSFLFQDFLRTASATALGEVHLGLLDTQRLAGEFACLSSGLRKFLLGISFRLTEISDMTVDLLTLGTSSRGEGEDKRFTPARRTLSERPNRYYDGINNALPSGTGNGTSPLVPLNEEDFLKTLMREQSYPSKDRASFFPPTNSEKDVFDIERLKMEYEGLSRTFKNMVENLASCVASATLLANHLRRGKS